MNAIQFRDIMRGPYINGIGYVGWSEEHVTPYVEEFASALPSIKNPNLKRNTKSYTITWEEGDSLFKSILQLEEDAFGGPIYHHDQFMVISNTVSTKKVEKEEPKKEEPKKEGAKKEKKGAPSPKKTASEKWAAVENADTLLQSHVLPLFYYLCLTKPPKDVVFL